MTTLLAPPPPEETREDTDIPISLAAATTGADRVFRSVLVASATTVLVVLAAIVGWLVIKGWPIARRAGFHFLTGTNWQPTQGKFGVLPLLVGSVAIALVAIVVAVPVSLCCALMINEYAPRWLRRPLTSVVDILATVPSIVYGFWGLEVLDHVQEGPAGWLVRHVSFVPIFRTPSPGLYLSSVFACGLVCALTIIPIVTSVSRDVMAQAPREACEAAYGLGGTRWGMVTDVLLPFSKNGIVGATLLGLGRGLGETMIVVIMLSSGNIVTPAIMGPDGLSSVALRIAVDFQTTSTTGQDALILAGLMLFVTALAVNVVARMIVSRTGAQGS